MFRSNNDLVGFLHKKTLYDNNQNGSSRTRKSSNKLKTQPSHNQTPPKNRVASRYFESKLNNESSKQFYQNHRFSPSMSKISKARSITKRIQSKQKQSVFCNQNDSKLKSFFVKRKEQDYEDHNHSYTNTYKNTYKEENNGYNGYSDSLQNKSSTNFQMSKRQCKTCIDDLSQKITLELKLIDTTMEEIKAELNNNWHKKINQLKNQIYRVIEQTFKQYQHEAEFVIVKKKQEHIRQLTNIRASLAAKEHQVLRMKKNINMEGNWRKVTGELFSSQIDLEIEKLISQSDRFIDKIAGSKLFSKLKQKNTLQLKKLQQEYHLSLKQTLKKLIEVNF